MYVNVERGSEHAEPDDEGHHRQHSRTHQMFQYRLPPFSAITSPAQGMSSRQLPSPGER